jgi:hypothetical protein
MFQFHLLTKSDWALVTLFALGLAGSLGGAVYWLVHLH